MAYGKHLGISKNIISELKRRNEREKRFEGIVKLCNSLYESTDLLQKDNFRLRIQNTKFGNPQVETSAEVTAADLTAVTLQRKVYELQTEITELHRMKSDQAKKVIDLKHEKEEKDKMLGKKEGELNTVKEAFRISKEKQDKLEDKANEMETNLQLVKDEYSALLLTYTSLEKSKHELEMELDDLTARWLVYKDKAVDELNAENEMMHKMHQMRIQKKIEEAIQEPVPSVTSTTRKESS